MYKNAGVLHICSRYMYNTHVIHEYDIYLYYTCISTHVIHITCVGYTPVLYVTCVLGVLHMYYMCINYMCNTPKHHTCITCVSHM